MAARKAVVVAYDAVSPLGIDLEVQWERALNGDSGIGPLTRFPLTETFPVRIAGQVPEIEGLAYPFLTPRELANWTSPVFKYALLTVQRALEKSGIEITKDLAPRVGITYSSAIGGLDAVLKADRLMAASGKLPHPYTNPNSCINMVGGKISMLTGGTGPIMSTITACATGITSMIVGAMLLEQNQADVVICGAVDFALVEPIAAGFSTMNGCFNPREGEEGLPPQLASRPFSINRRGFVISEGAGAVILAAKEFVEAHGLETNIEIAGYAMTSDAYHFVAPNVETVTQCMDTSLHRAGIGPAQIDLVNAHAASTRVGDAAEFRAMQSVFKGSLPPVTANKSLIGHAMGASSAIESIFCFEGMLTGKAPPTINYQQDPEMPLDCIPEGCRPIVQEFTLKNAFGFGGCNACAVFQRVK
jgi:3-oxoacyl-[acyl-carrier-protein] synthase II